MKRLSWFLLCLFIAPLGGCYQADAPVLSDGQQLPLEGPFECKWGDAEFHVTYTEIKDSPPLTGSPDSYAYRTDKGHVLQAKKIKDTLFVGQMLLKASKGDVFLVFHEFLPGGFLILGERHPQADTIAARHHVQLGRDNSQVSRISGNAADILAFLMDHDADSLIVPGRCSAEN